MSRWLDDFWFDIGQELRWLRQLLASANTWIAIGVLAAFGLLIYFGMKIALRYDTLMFLLGARINLCRVLSDTQYFVLIYMLFFFVIAAFYCLGSLTNYLTERNSRRPLNRRRLAIHTLLGGLVTLLIGALVTGFLNYWC